MPVVRPSPSPRFAVLVALGLVLAGFSWSVTANEMKFRLSGDREVPPVLTSASGQGVITVNNDMTISGKVTTSGLTPSMAHIRHGKPGSNGSVIVPLDKVDDNVWVVPNGTKLDEDGYRAYLAGELYVNVHSAAYPGGEIRGQLRPGKAALKSQ